MRRSCHTFVRAVATLLVMVIAMWHAFPARSVVTAAVQVRHVEIGLHVATAGEGKGDRSDDERSAPSDDRRGDAGDEGEGDAEGDAESEDEERAESIEALVFASPAHPVPESRAAFEVAAARCPDEASLEVVSPPPEA